MKANWVCAISWSCIYNFSRLINSYCITSFLLTIPPSVGYEQNPLSLYYCFDVEGAARTLRKCIAEVSFWVSNWKYFSWSSWKCHGEFVLFGCTNYLPSFSLSRVRKALFNLHNDINMILLQVTNTPWGERVTFVFNPNSDVVAKPLHVSPFMVGYPWLIEDTVLMHYLLFMQFSRILLRYIITSGYAW